MTEHETTPAVLHPVSGSGRSGSGFADLAPEIQADLYRRLGGVALVYAGAWIATFIFYQFSQSVPPDEARRNFWYTTTAICTALGLVMYWVCKKRLIPARSFANVALAFEVVGGLGIMAGAFGWEIAGSRVLAEYGRALGIDGDVRANIVVPLQERGIRIFYHEGVTWVSVWLLVFPLVVPAPMRRTVVATLLTAATVPAVLLLSVAVHGMPPELAGWALPYMLELIVPTFISAGIAIFGAQIVYRLTRDLSKAKRMGSYQLLEKIGAGGMGEVWKAKHRLLVRPAAIKFIRSDVFGRDADRAESIVRRFEREAQATAKLTSPHTVDLYDFGIASDGTFYYVMELLEGIDLRTLVEKYGPQPPERTIHILRQVCHALTDAHEQGLVHRDIKPANIFVCRRGQDFDFVKVLDFGLVKVLWDSASPGSQVTMEGIASGTPTFMAPEMASDERNVDARADIYALGCVAYWLLTGKIVFEGESAVAILLKHARDEAPPLSSRTTRPIPGDLERLVLECLRKDPKARPQSARALMQRLAACGEKLPPWDEQQAREWWLANQPEPVTVS